MGRAKPKTAKELIEASARDPNLTPAQALIALSRLALHLGTTDAAELHTVGPALGHLAQGLGKVVAASEKGGGGDGDDLWQRFLDPNAKR